MSKNMILLIGLILLWLFVIRPISNRNSSEVTNGGLSDYDSAGSGTVTAGGSISEGLADIADAASEAAQKQSVSGHVDNSKAAAAKTYSEELAQNGYRSYTS
jgi:hypothetical protein